jgi:hypothetical protein
VRTYLGDSRGRWEGDTLVIETTNLNGLIPANFNGRQAADASWVLPTSALRIVERITRVERDLLRYEATITDPGTFTRPYTMVIPLTSPPGYRMFPTNATRGTWRSARPWAQSEPRTERWRKTPSVESYARGVPSRAN